MNKMKKNVIASVAKQSFAALSIASLVFMTACGDDSSSGPSSTGDEPELSSSSNDDEGSSSSKKKGKSSSSVGEASSSSVEESSSSSEISVSLTGVVFGSDYSTGELRWIDKDGKISESSLSFHQDSKVVTNGADLYVLERKGADNITKIDPEKLESKGKKAVVWQVSLDDEANPVDMAFDGDQAWVALQNADSLVKISTEDGKVKKSIKIGKFAYEGEHSPYVADIELDDGSLYVLMQRYTQDENYVVTYPKGLLAIYDASTGDLKDTIQLKSKNPSNVAVIGGNVYVATHGEYNAAYGTDADSQRGIEKVNVSKKKSELLISGEDLGGGIASMVVDGEVVYVSINLGYDENYAAIQALKKVDISAKKVDDVEGFTDMSGSMAIDDGLLYVGDRSVPAVVTWNGKKKNTIKQPKGALPPYNIALF
ncbi:PQQ-binding-like beta-propeller repeat protein [uncultured Fibrobacter sp.]|uniref:YncE family protein n=1 Tax=uncultured Fibrobacter sp. TaxID=261512 RepID=UPI0025F5B2F9|nr:PQQ-binding-like beta-propeller repeat protein [uncultured Fibrobacter sp.]